jgi:hypothetical protein
MSAKPIRRITLFKVPTEEGQEQLLAKYRTLRQEALKVLLFPHSNYNLSGG